MGVNFVQPLADSPRMPKRQKTIDKQDVYTPPASPPEIVVTGEEVQSKGACECYDDDHDDAVLMGILDLMRRIGGSAMCSREISEGLLLEGKVPLVGATPSTLVDSAIKQHHKRCTSNNRSNIIEKIADPRFPRKTLYHLANADPFAPRRAEALQPKAEVSKPARPTVQRKKDRQQQQLPQQQQQQQMVAKVDESSDASDSDSGPAHILEALVNDCQGPFAASFDTRRRMSLSFSEDDLDFSLSIDDICAAPTDVPTPVPSLPVSPSKEMLQKALKLPPLNIAIPPSPFIAPRDKDDSETGESVHTIKFSGDYTKQSNRTRESVDDDFFNVDVQSPEAVSLDDLDCLLGF